jgi:hypothetical protein
MRSRGTIAHLMSNVPRESEPDQHIDSVEGAQNSQTQYLLLFMGQLELRAGVWRSTFMRGSEDESRAE